MKTVFEFIKKTTNRELFFTLLNQAVLSLGAVAVVVVLSNLLSAEVFGKTRFLASVLAIAAFFSIEAVTGISVTVEEYSLFLSLEITSAGLVFPIS